MSETSSVNFPATVVKVIDEYKVVINRGTTNEIKLGQRFLIYRLDNELIKDPDSGEELGYLEIVRGTGKVVHLQNRLATIESDKQGAVERRVIKRKMPVWAITGSEEEIVTPTGEILPFEDAEYGDKAKPI